MIRDIIRYYTREAGVRNLEREISKICRKVVKEILLAKSSKKITITPAGLDKYLGVKRFRYGEVEDYDQIGQVTGLAWTEVGGELLKIETALVPGKGRLTHTGQLGDVMQESIQAAMNGGAQSRECFRYRNRFLPETGYSCARAGRGDAEGRSQRRHRHVHLSGFGADRHLGQGRCGDDWRNHPTG